MTTFIPSMTLPAEVFHHPAASVLLPVALGTAVGYSSRPNETKKTYMALKQPPLHPPAWLFGPVWTALYGLMGYASHRVAAAGLSHLASPASVATTQHSLTLYTVQLGLNLVWMPLFFVAKRPVAATVDILALIGLNGYMTYLWSQVDEVAAWCQVPYLGWLGFATYLCAGAGYLNNWDLSTKQAEPRDVKQ